jgi:N-acetylglucosaminyldiphosphoundecaprenol N-acetyl-beta-D-mannosaminyltransferase/alpha-1,3-mannosyltransferase
LNVATPPRRGIGPVFLPVLRREQAVEEIVRHMAGRAPLMVAFCNAHSVNIARRDEHFRAALAEALLLNDGIGVDIASRWLHGENFPDNLNGTDLTPALLAAAPPADIFLLGSPPGVADIAAGKLARRFPQHRFVGAQHGYFTPEEDEAIVARILASGASLVLVGMGQPRQEEWAARYFQRIPGVTMCIGAYLDFAAERFARAPRWVRALRAEWLFRLAMEPRRMAGRYIIGNATFLLTVARERIARQTGRIRR